MRFQRVPTLACLCGYGNLLRRALEGAVTATGQGWDFLLRWYLRREDGAMKEFRVYVFKFPGREASADAVRGPDPRARKSLGRRARPTVGSRSEHSRRVAG